MEEQSERATEVLKENLEAVERVVKALLEREQLTGDEFITVFSGGSLPPLHEATLLASDDNKSTQD